MLISDAKQINEATEKREKTKVLYIRHRKRIEAKNKRIFRTVHKFIHKC